MLQEEGAIGASCRDRKLLGMGDRHWQFAVLPMKSHFQGVLDDRTVVMTVLLSPAVSAGDPRASFHVKSSCSPRLLTGLLLGDVLAT